MHCLLFYDFVDDVVAKRASHREAHLALAQEWVASGRLLLGGAYAEPVDGAVLVFAVDGPDQVEEFVRRDPYVAAGLVTDWRIRPWTVVVGAAL